jgi:hypothetical protein
LASRSDSIADPVLQTARLSLREPRARNRHAGQIGLAFQEVEPSQRVDERIGMTPGRRVQFHGFEHIVFGLTTT